MSMNTIQTREVGAAIAQLRAEIERIPQDKGGKRQGIPTSVKRRAAAIYPRSGLHSDALAAALAVSSSALYSWRKRYGADSRQEMRARGFKKVSVEAAPLQATSGPGLTIEGPGGMRITGLDAAGVARIWRALC
jgi:transposase-like protein